MSDSLITNEEFYDVMFHRGVYCQAGEWPSSTIMLYRIRIKRAIGDMDMLLHRSGCFSLQCERWMKLANEPGCGPHSEKIFIKHVNNLIVSLRKNNSFFLTIKQVTIDIVLNFSPCSGCAEKLIELKNTIGNVVFCVMHIKFANFYKHYDANNMRKLIKMVQHQVQISVFDGLCDWKEFLDNTVNLPLNLQSDEFYKTWLVRQERELVDSVLLECIKRAAMKWRSFNKELKKIIGDTIKQIDSTESALKCLKEIQQ